MWYDDSAAACASGKFVSRRRKTASASAHLSMRKRLIASKYVEWIAVFESGASCCAWWKYGTASASFPAL